jgi:predicted GIY-YIG superfamily endonuclease
MGAAILGGEVVVRGYAAWHSSVIVELLASTMGKECFVYIMASRRNGTLYVGVSSDLVQRVWQHKTKSVPGFTTKYGVDRLVSFEAHGDAASAIRR